jgi:rhodanese-related sulfurtransferase
MGFARSRISAGIGLSSSRGAAMYSSNSITWCHYSGRFAALTRMTTEGRAMRMTIATVITLTLTSPATAQTSARIQSAVLGESDQTSTEVSTEELQRILTEGSAVVFDARPYREFAVSHVPGARNVSAKPGVPMSMYVSDAAAIDRALKGRKDAPIVLYCNGPFCGKSKRLAQELQAAGFTAVRRYQLGIPVWRALGGVCEIEPEGLGYVLGADRTAVVIDAAESAAFKGGTLPGARNIPRSLVLEGKDVGEIKRAKDDGRLPMEDHNTRIIVIARDPAAARYVAQAIAREAFHNVVYFKGTLADALTAAKLQASAPKRDR